ncbi:unnamed protein product [Closterium sp. NIES-54]
MAVDVRYDYISAPHHAIPPPLMTATVLSAQPPLLYSQLERAVGHGSGRASLPSTSQSSYRSLLSLDYFSSTLFLFLPPLMTTFPIPSPVGGALRARPASAPSARRLCHFHLLVRCCLLSSFSLPKQSTVSDACFHACHLTFAFSTARLIFTLQLTGISHCTENLLLVRLTTRANVDFFLPYVDLVAASNSTTELLIIASGQAQVCASWLRVGTARCLAEAILDPTPPLMSPPPVQSQLQPAAPLPCPSPYFGPTRGLTERCELESCPVSPESRPESPESRSESPICTVCAGRRATRPRPPPDPGTHSLSLNPSTAPQRVPLPTPPASSLPDGPDPESDSLRAASPTVTRILATAVTDPFFESTAASALVAELVDFAAACRLDYATIPVAESASVCPRSVGGECALGTDFLEDREEKFECFATAAPHLVSMLLAPEGDPDALDIPTPRSYAEAIEGPYSSQWQAAMDAKMASWKSTGTYVNEVPLPRANIVTGMRIFRVKRPPGSPPVFKARYVARAFSQPHGLDFSTAFLQGSLHEEIWLRRPLGFTGSFPPGTQWSLQRPVYGHRQAPREWHDTLRTTLAALGFAPSTTDPSLFLRTGVTLPPFYVLVYVDDLVFATADTEALAHVKSELQKRHTCTDLAPPSDESVEPSGPYPELVGCLMYLMTCTQPDPAYSLSLLARYVAPGRHRKVHWDTAKRVLRYLCSTSGMGLVLGAQARVVLTGHADASWAEIYTGAMAAQELRWLTYLLTNLGEAPRSPPVLYVDNKAMLALCQEHRVEHRTKHIALRYFLARELQ